ncbi:hypothetical protein MTP99_011107 [Tenebrio molitor]|jgi:hypothetical protein|nr:hypothetical protein MTP99_011107 [Tenebrio molitor]
MYQKVNYVKASRVPERQKESRGGVGGGEGFVGGGGAWDADTDLCWSCRSSVGPRFGWRCDRGTLPGCRQGNLKAANTKEMSQSTRVRHERHHSLCA